ncbi:hypothetical protein XELAEV_18002839mg [Xenopus laevis]|nr:hypothetical protein XELAEV_18002839mg [Xenopus laevis]
MKVDRTKLKKTPTEAPADCRSLIDKLKVCSDEQLLLELQQIKTWNIGKCELYHWVDLLDRFDGILADAGQTVENMSWMLVCDRPEREQLKALLLAVLNFTALLIEYSFSRHLYSSIEHLTTLLASSDMQVVLAVLNLLYVFSKRSNYITRLASDKRTPLLSRLQHLAESWGGKENGFGLAECCKDMHLSKYPPSATTLHFEFYAEPGSEVKVEKRLSSNTLHYIHIEQLDKISESPSEIMESLTKMYSIPKDKQMLLFTHIRLAHGFSNHKKRLQAVQARLHAISILVYSNALQESANSILYNGLIEELVDVLQITDKQLMEIKAASLRTLTSIVHLERTPKLSSIIDCTGTASYHGFLPVLVRNCIQAMIDPTMEPYPHQFATALFSFLYHLASYDAGGEALVSCGMMEALLKVIKFLGDEQDQITFVTRAVRVVDLITNLDMAAFQSHSGLSIFIYRLEHEVDLCRKECPFVIKPKIQRPTNVQEGEEMETDMEGVQCIPQRAALLKSMLNFLKKAIQDPSFSDGIRHVMDGTLPTSLKHIISNAEYYGPSLFLLDVMLHALLIKDVPATREVLGSLPNVFSALCLNARGLQSFVQCQPFERLFKVLLSPDYLPAMRRRRSSDPLALTSLRSPAGDTASNLGSAVDELMRHQPTLKTDATTAIIKLLEEICNLGRDPKYICQKPSIQKADGTATAPPPRSNHAAEEASSEDEEEEEVQAMQSFSTNQQSEVEPIQHVVGTEERIPIPLMDYILNVTLSHEPKVLHEGLLQLDSILSSLDPLHRPIEAPGGSVLLRELACAGNVADATLSAQATPLLHALTAAHAYIMMFVHTCRVGQSEIRAISVNQWGSQLGLSVLNKLSQLYCSLVWESTVLLSLCTPNSLPPGCEFGQADMQKLAPKEEKAATVLPQGTKRPENEAEGSVASDEATGLLEGIGLDGDTLAPMETDEPNTSDAKGKPKITPAMAARIKQIKPLLSASSRLGRALAELFGLLVKLCVGSPVRQRRSHHAASTTTAPTPAARSTASALTKLLTKGLSWQPPSYTPTPRFRLTFFICSVGFTSPMLFDERKYPYHLMLQKFLCSGGHNALFETFNWALSMGGRVPVAEGLEHSDLPDGTGEFLDAWLMLVEKMVNPTTVLESPHSLPSTKLPGGQNNPQFSALRFLVVTQKLMDMGFTREHALDALLNTSTMEQATEYLLTHPPPLVGGVVREDQMLRAIAMSLGQDITMEQRAELPEVHPNMANTVNAALKPLETLSRIVNQPSSLFGNKGTSGKNKSEADAHGTARDPNSNQTDTVVKVPIINHLESLRDEELEERREKRRKQLAEEEAKMADRSKEEKDTTEQNSQLPSTRESAVTLLATDSSGILEEPLPSTSSEEEDPLAGINLPEGVDPSFLAALPEDIRREVLQNQLGIRPPSRPPPTAAPVIPPPVVANAGVTEVSPEFLAALPPAIQEEVLAQQRAEQQRRELVQSTTSENPMDPVTFIQTLPSDLRRSVLEDMEDSVLAVMPPDIAAEAQALRREQESRQRQLMHERLFGHSSTSALSAILRSPAFTSRLSGNRGVQYTRLAVQRGNTFQMGSSSTHTRPTGSNVDSLLRLRGRLLLDHEALSCLLVLLFVDEPKLNTSRLHRVLRNLCYHAQTRNWVIRSLLSILQRSSESELCIESPKTSIGGADKRAGAKTSHDNRPLELLHKMESRNSNQLSWLSVSMDAALGCRTNIFQIQRSLGRKHTEKHAACGSTVHIHPQAAPVVCRHVLDTLIQLAKVFPSHFTQQRTKECSVENSDSRERSIKLTCSPCLAPSSSVGASNISTDFWDLLVKLDNMNVSRKGKTSIKSLPMSSGSEGESNQCSLEASPLGQLMNMLSHSVIRRSSLLTEKLLRLLSLISIALPDNKASESAVIQSNAITPAPAPTPATAPAPAPVPAVTVPTVVSTSIVTTVTTKSGKSPAKSNEFSNAPDKMAVAGLTEKQLQLSVEVLTSHSCSEEGLEDAANVLLQLSRGDPSTRDTVLKLLLSGAHHLGSLPTPPLRSRFDIAENVVIVASQKRPLGGRELQLPSMSMLTSKTSTQKFFLRVLQVIIQLRDDTRRANKKAKQTSRLGTASLASASSIQAAVQQLEAEADAIIQMAEGSARREEQPMDVDQPSPAAQETPSVATEVTQAAEKKEEERLPELPLLSEQLMLQPAVEAFFLVHATERESKPPVRDTRESQLSHIKDEPPPLSPAPLTPATPSSLDPFFSREPSSMHISSSLPPDTQKFLRFAETHRTVLNQILRQSTTHLADGPFAVLVDYIRVLDFDVKRKYFRQELERLDEGLRKEDMAVHVRRDHVFEDSYRELHRKSPEEMKNRLYIVFEGEEGQDAGGLLREWYMIISREMFNPMYALFRTSPGDRVTYTINPSSHCNPNHLSYFKFVGRIVAKAVYDNRLLECYFTRSFYKHIMGKSVRYTDMESEDYHFYQGLVYLLENDVSTLGYDLTFSTEVQEFGVCEVRDLKPNGANILVTEENKKEYVHLVCQMKMTGAIRKQLAAFLEGYYEIIPKRLISIFTEQELELLISGLPTIDIDDLKSNTEYHKYQSNSIQIQWFWRALRSFDQADRAKFLQFVTGTSKVPLQGFAALEGMNGIQKFQIHRDDRSTDRLPSAHTCFNQLDLPAYESYEKLRHMLLLAIQECSEGFGLA